MKREWTIECRKKMLHLSQKTHVMGILNVTPDSFYDGGEYFSPKQAVARGRQMAAEGADIIDIGGQSTRPGSDWLSEEEELARILPVIEELSPQLTIPISVDTVRAGVAAQAIAAGAEIINDISGGRFDPAILTVAARQQVPIILMHIRGTPKTMQLDIHYDDLFGEMAKYFQETIQMAEDQGIDPGRIIIDPGIGFGKRLEDNLAIIANLDYFSQFEKPILIGLSRKSFLGKILDIDAAGRLSGTIAANALSIWNGAEIIRVHDVIEGCWTARLIDLLKSSRFAAKRS
jgi:dihydropteroate synthase